MGFVIATAGPLKWVPFYFTGEAGHFFLSPNPAKAKVYASERDATKKADSFNHINLDGRVYRVIPQPRVR